jgi:hypothetical protein
MTEAEWLKGISPSGLLSFIADTDPNCVSLQHVMLGTRRNL